MIARTEFLNELLSFKDKKLIKVISGIRRCGKSTLLDLFEEHLLKIEIPKERIVHINLEDGEFDNLKTCKELYDFVNNKLIQDKMNYVMLDEVQNVENFQKACDSLFVKKNVDLYITGSNARLLSGELATLLSGRYVEIKMLPLSFKEYISARGKSDLQIKFSEYLKDGSFPYTLQLDSANEKRIYLDGIYNTILIKDVAYHNKISDIPMLVDIVKFMFSIIGSEVSSTNIANTMTSKGRKISVPTVESYLKALTDAFILYKAERYDIKGKQILASGAKYYVADTGLRYFILGSKNADVGHLLENIVYLELLRRGCKVSVGKIGNTEIDFVAENQNDTKYYQVAWSAVDEETLKRELHPLEAVKDHNAKYLLTMDFIPSASHNGIKQMNVLEWLLGE